MRQLLYRPSWQALRVSFLKENREDGGWTTQTGTDANLHLLDNYVVGDGNFMMQALNEARAMGYEEKHEYAARLYRAINCLNAVRMGNSGQGRAVSPEDKAVLEARNHYQACQTVVYHELLTYASVRWDWRVVRRELQNMIDGTPNDFAAIEKSLKARMERTAAMRKRPELNTFLLIMKEVREGD
jgi:hypothetical protein